LIFSLKTPSLKWYFTREINSLDQRFRGFHAMYFVQVLWTCIAFHFLLFSAGLCPAYAFTDWTPLIQRLAADQFEEKDMRLLFSHPGVMFDPDAMSTKLKELIRNRFHTTRPASPAIRSEIYDRFLEEPMISEARSFTQKNIATLEEIEKAYCVPKEIVVAILLVETELGGYLGSRPAFNTLASMASSTSLDIILPHLPSGLITPETSDFAMKRCRQRADWAYRELKALIRYASQSSVDPLSIPGSMYGAIGISQFMPSNISVYGIDANNDGHIDLFAVDDALFSTANFLYHHGWKCNISRPKKRKVIMAYNRSTIYANTVLQVADTLRQRN
jgi:membrane-bound lytic murein transglycosylase B